MAQPYNRILFDPKKEINSDRFYNMMNPEDIMLNKRNQTQSGYCRVLLIQGTYNSEIYRQKNGLVADDKSFGDGCGDDCRIIRAYLIPLNDTIK